MAEITSTTALEAGAVVLANLKAKLLDPNTASARAAEQRAADALGQLENAYLCIELEAKRQAGVAAARAKAQAEKSAADKAAAELKERKRHEATLKAEIARESALTAARRYLKDQAKETSK